MANQKPHDEVRIGTVKAAIWQNDVAGNTRYGVTFSQLELDVLFEAYKCEPEKPTLWPSFMRILLGRISEVGYIVGYIECHKRERSSTVFSGVDPLAIIILAVP